jgi:hypothetical protein
MQRSMSRPAAVAMLAVAAAGVTACSGPQSPDLFLVKRTGTIPGARLTLRISDDGGAFCNGGPRKEITSAQLIEARALRRELDGEKDEDVGLAERKIHLKPGRITTLSYTVRSEKGSVSFSDTSAHQPSAFYRLAKLTRDIARGPCGLPR